MKRFLALLMVVVMLFVLAACGENKDTNSADTNINNTQDYTQGIDSSTTGGEDNSSLGTTTSSSGNTATTNSIHTHEYVDKVNAATCTKEGYTLHTCSCGDSYSDNKTPAAGHNFGEWNTTKEPTTTATGIAERKCSKCNETETRVLGKLIDNHKHSYTSQITIQPSCKGDGQKTYSCSCGDTYSESVASVDHQYGHKVTNPTCTNEGYTTFTCTVCGNSYRDDFTHPTGHNWKAATCTVEKTCLTCGQTEGVVYGHAWKAATCTQPLTCKQCGKTTGAALGHDWKAATCTQPSTCKQCGETTGAALGHDWKAATCTDAKKCKVCKATEGSANGHDWIEGNCTTPKTCSVCNVIEGEAIHTFVNNKCTLCGCKKPSEGLSFFEYKGGYYLLTAGSCLDTNIVIPTTYRGKPVVGIYKFFGERTNNDDRAVINSDSITSIYIPDCITDIGSYVFCDCSNLTNVIFGGTKQQWNAISKGEYWYLYTIVVTCTDGIITYS